MLLVRIISFILNVVYTCKVSIKIKIKKNIKKKYYFQEDCSEYDLIKFIREKIEEERRSTNPTNPS